MSLEGLTFATPQLEQELTELTQAIDKVAGEKWEQKGWHKETHSNTLYRLWCSEPGVIVLLEEPPSMQPKSSYHMLRLSAYVNSRKSPAEIQVFAVRSRWQAPRGQWGAYVESRMGNSAKPEYHTELAFERDRSTTPRIDLEGIATNAWLDDYSGYFTFGGVRYVANIRTQSFNNSHAISPSDLLRWYDSADHFREDWAARLTRLEEQAKRDIPSGAAISQGESDQPDEPNRQGIRFSPLRSTPALTFLSASREIANVPPPPRFRSSRKTTPAEREQVLKKALEVIGGRKQQLEDEYKELHAALVKALPLADLLREKMRKQD